MLELRNDLKDWEISREWWGDTTKEHCQLIKRLRSKSLIISVCDGWYEIVDLDKKDEIGWLIPSELIEKT